MVPQIGAAAAPSKVGKEPIVADAVEAPGQHVHQEAPDELVRVKQSSSGPGR